MLRHAVIRSIHLSDMDPVPGFNQRVEQLENVEAVFGGQEALDVLKYERHRLDSGDRVGEPSDQRVSMVTDRSCSRGGEALAGRPSNYDGN